MKMTSTRSTIDLRKKSKKTTESGKISYANGLAEST
jgi:hypothetical protein